VYTYIYTHVYIYIYIYIYVYMCRNLVSNSTFQTFSSTCVAVNVLFNLTDHASASEFYENIVQQQNNVFNYVLFVEVFLSLIGYGPGGFVDDKWKAFDAFVAVGSLAGMIVSLQHTATHCDSLQLTATHIYAHSHSLSL